MIIAAINKKIWIRMHGKNEYSINHDFKFKLVVSSALYSDSNAASLPLVSYTCLLSPIPIVVLLCELKLPKKAGRSWKLETKFKLRNSAILNL